MRSQFCDKISPFLITLSKDKSVSFFPLVYKKTG